MSPELTFAIGMGTATVCFGAGIVVHQIRARRNADPPVGEYITSDLCAAYREIEAERWEHVCAKLDRITDWVDKQRD